MINKAMLSWFLCINCFLVSGTFFRAGADTELKDIPYFSGMPNHMIVEATDQEFNDFKFYNGKDCTTVEGRKYYRVYTIKEGAKQSSDLQILRNYENAVKNMGGTVIFTGECSGADCDYCGYRMMTGKVVKDGNEMWVEVVPYNDGIDYDLIVLVKEEMKQDVTASSILDSLNRDGRVTLYINFDTGKSTIKPESESIIQQIIQMLKDNPDLKISVEGHTDNVGNAKSNKALSENRAKAVVAAIAAQGIDSKSLSAIGYGQDKPIADNKSEEGRAKNRRVELVKI